MEITMILGYIAAVCTPILMVPQLLIMYRETTTGTSMTWLIFSLMTSILWFLYGIGINSPVITTANCVSVIMHAIMISLKLYREWFQHNKLHQHSQNPTL